MLDKKIEFSAENLLNAESIGNDNVIANGKIALAAGRDMNLLRQEFHFHPTLPVEQAEISTINKVLDRAIDVVKDLLTERKPLVALEEIAKIEKTFAGALNDPNAKRRLYLNKGTALILTNQPAEGAKWYLEGYACATQDPLANALRIKAYFLMNDVAGIKKAISEIPTAHTTSRSIAGHILEAIQTDTKNFPTMPDAVNELCFDDPANCIMASRFYSNRGDERKAAEFFDKAKKANAEDWQVLAMEGSMLMGDDPHKTPAAQVQQAKDLLEKSWEAIKNQTSIPFTHILYIPINLSSAYRVLGMKKAEKELVESLYQQFPEEQDVILKKILIIEDKKEASDLAETLAATKSFQYAIVAATAHINAKEYNKALDILKNVPNDEMYDQLEVDFMKVVSYKGLNDILSIDEIISKQKSHAVKNFFTYAKTDNINDLLKAYKMLRKHDSMHIRAEIAVRLYCAQQYAEAATLYKDVIKSFGASDVFLKHYLNCLWQIKRLPDLRAELEKIPKENMDNSIKQYWAAYYGSVGDYDNAIIMEKEIFEAAPNDANYALNLSSLYHQTKQTDNVVALLDALPTDLSLMGGEFASKWQLMLLMKEYNYDLDNLTKKAYELFCGNIEDGEAWASYFAWFMSGLSKANLENDKTGIVLQDKANNATKIYFIDDNPNVKTNKFFNVLCSNDPLAKRLMATNPKDIIKLDTGGIDLEVFSVNNKYILLGHIIQKHIFIEFPNCAIQRFDGATPEEAIEKIKLLFDTRQENFDLLKGYYYKQALPVSAMASMLGSDSITIMNTLANERFVVASGLIPERQQVLELIQANKSYIIDALTLFNVFAFGMQNYLAEYLKDRIYVSQKTKDIIRAMSANKEDAIKHRNGFMFPTEQSEHKVAIASFDDLEPSYKAQLELFNNISTWLDENAKVVIPSGKIDLADDKKLLLSFFQENDAETSIIIETAIENGLAILSDDYTFRLMAKHQFGVDGIWAQGLFMYSTIKTADYAPFILKSIMENHTFISFDYRVLLATLVADKTENLQDFSAVAKRLGDCSSDSAFRVICDLYKELLQFKQQTPQIANILIDGFLGGGACRDFDWRLSGMQWVATQDEIFAKALQEWCVGHFIQLSKTNNQFVNK